MNAAATLFSKLLPSIAHGNDLHLNRLKQTHMFNQVVADGANLFVIILAVIVGFASALGYIDYQKTTKNQQRPE